MIVLAAVVAASLTVQKQYEAHDSARLVPMLMEVLRFSTVEGNLEARAAQQQWLMHTARELGLSASGTSFDHAVVEVYMPEHSKWVLVDPDFNIVYRKHGRRAIPLIRP